MIRLITRSLAASRLRLALTAVAIVLGVSFVTASFVLADGLRASFRELSGSINGGTDLSLRSVDGLGEQQPVPAELVDEVRAVDGVAATTGFIQVDGVQPVRADGAVVTTMGPPQFGFGWTEDPALNQFTVVEGRAVRDGAEFSVDEGTAADNDLRVGERYDVVTPTGRHGATLVGIVRFGPENATLGATLTQFPTATAQAWLGMEGLVTSVDIRLDDGADAAAVAEAVAALAPAGTEVVDQATLVDETAEEYTVVVDIVGNVLLGFAVISLFVSSFIIANTFAIVVGQRTRELALLRALGASGGQVRRLVLAEAGVLGVTASLVGVAAGLGVTLGLRAAFAGLGLDLPAADLVVAPRTWMVALGMGIGVTMLAAVRPAARASAVAPVAAMATNVAGAEVRPSRRAGVVAAVLLAAAAGFAVLAAAGAGLPAVVAAAITLVVGAVRVAPRLAHPFASTLRRPLGAAFGLSGRMAGANAARNPRRTANSGAALMVGLAVVTAAFIVGASMKTRISSVVESTVTADLVLSPQGSGGVPGDVAAQLENSGLFAEVTPWRTGEVQVGEMTTSVIGMHLTTALRLLDLDLAAGTVATGAGQLMLSTDEAERLGASVGDELQVTLPLGTVEQLTVTAVYRGETLVGPALVDLGLWDGVTRTPTDDAVVARFAPTVQESDRAAALSRLDSTFPQLNVETADQFVDRIAGQIDQLLMVVNLMVALTVIIALLGITNTLALAVIERTRELGLLRAVGMGRREVRRTIRLEAAIIAAFGTALGLSVGLVLGWLGVEALPDDFATDVTVPVTALAIVAVLAVVAAVLAAQVPARRAARLDVLTAIAS